MHHWKQFFSRTQVIFTALACAAALAACSTTTIRATPDARPYQYVYIGEISIVSPENDPDDIAANKEVVEHFKNEFRKRLRNGALEVVDSSESRPRMLIAEGKGTIDYGNRALRMLAGIFGAGKGTGEFTVTVKDAMTGQQVAIEHQTTSKRMGPFGGSMVGVAESLMEDVADDMTEQILDLGSRVVARK